MDKIQKLILENKAWATGKVQNNPDFFKSMADVQKPDYLWIGCSDSRVDPSELTNTQPGEMFVHRNVANLVVHTDLNLLSVVQFAVEALQVDHIIVCGHYNCGGVKAAMGSSSIGVIDHWIRNIKDTYSFYKFDVDGIKSESERVNRLVELNVMNQVKNLANTSIIQKAWKNRPGYPALHGWVYDINTGLIKQIAMTRSEVDVDSAHRYTFNP
jgi:carbonic anhydrase